MIIERNKKVEHIDFQNSTALSNDTPSGIDIGFFSSQLNQNSLSSDTRVKSGTPSLLAEVSELFNQSKERVARRFKAVSSNKDPHELRKLPMEFSQTILTSQLLVKSLGKTTQSIDKICNLQ